MTCQDVDIIPAIQIPIFLTISPHLTCKDCINRIEVELRNIFSSGYHNGEPAFFNPKKWSFGKNLYKSQVCAEALKVKGVEYITVEKLVKWSGERALNSVKIKANEVVTLGGFAVEWGSQL